MVWGRFLARLSLIFPTLKSLHCHLCIALHCTALHDTTLHCILLRCTAQFNTSFPLLVVQLPGYSAGVFAMRIAQVAVQCGAVQCMW